MKLPTPPIVPPIIAARFDGEFELLLEAGTSVGDESDFTVVADVGEAFGCAGLMITVVVVVGVGAGARIVDVDGGCGAGVGVGVGIGVGVWFGVVVAFRTAVTVFPALVPHCRLV